MPYLTLSNFPGFGSKQKMALTLTLKPKYSKLGKRGTVRKPYTSPVQRYQTFPVSGPNEIPLPRSLAGEQGT